MTGKGYRSAGLYRLQRSTSINFILNNIPIDVSHARLGHPSSNCLKVLSSSFDFIRSSFNSVCDVFPRAKQSRLSFNKSSITSRSSFELIYIDIWGPFFISSTCDAGYFLTIIDDYSRCT